MALWISVPSAFSVLLVSRPTIPAPPGLPACAALIVCGVGVVMPGTVPRG